jgi:hypothetical protein
MSKELVSLSKCVLLVLLLFPIFGQILVCFADMPNPGPRKHDVEIQGAKIISEGGYLWFHVINHESSSLYIVIHYPPDVKVIREIPLVILESNESSDFYFQAPYYWSGIRAEDFSQVAENVLSFSFEIFSLYHGTKIGTESVEFDVKVVPLNGGADSRDLLYLTVFVAIAVVVSALVVAARLTRLNTQSTVAS